MDPASLSYPILAFDDTFPVAYLRPEHLSIAYIGEIQSGYFKNLLLVDSDGRQFTVTHAEAHPTLWQRAINWLVGQRVHVALELAPATKPRDFSDIRGMVLSEMRKGGRWETREDFEDCLQKVESADGIQSLVRAYSAAEFAGVEA